MEGELMALNAGIFGFILGFAFGIVLMIVLWDYIRREEHSVKVDEEKNVVAQPPKAAMLEPHYPTDAGFAEHLREKGRLGPYKGMGGN